MKPTNGKEKITQAESEDFKQRLEHCEIILNTILFMVSQLHEKYIGLGGKP